jgi:dipeptidyl aminopeptidase/acylaminoacyl peptidase
MTQHRRSRAWIRVFIATVACVWGVSVQAQRPLTVQDVLKLEELGSVAVSPDGEWLAYVIKRPRAQAFYYKGFSDDRSDVWVVSTKGGQPKNLTHGAKDGAGFWAPQWSPDGRLLAMLSTRGGNIHLWVLELPTNRLRRVIADVVDNDIIPDAPLWVSNRSLFVPVRPADQTESRMTVTSRAAERAIRDWPKAWKGQLSANVIETGNPSAEKRTEGKLLLVDVKTGGQRLVTSGYIRQMRPSPDGRFVAFLKMADKIVPDTTPLPAWQYQGDRAYLFRAEIATATGEIVTGGVSQIRGVFPGTLTWAPEGSTLALAGYDGERATTATIFRYDPSTSTLETLSTTGLEILSPFQTGSGLPLRVSRTREILVFTRSVQSISAPAEPTRPEWWKVGRDGAPTRLTGDGRAVPSSLIAERESDTFVGLVGGDLLRFNVATGTTQNLTEAFGPSISSIVWPSRVPAQGIDRVVVRVPGEPNAGYYEIDLKTGKQRMIANQSARASVSEYLPKQSLMLFSLNDRFGTRMWFSGPTSTQNHMVLETNTFLKTIAEGGLKRIEYRSLSNESLTGWIILPVGYQEGRRYPLVAWVYPGSTYGRQSPRSASLNWTVSLLNLQLLASHGYAVLLPSMPIADVAGASDPIAELPDGVLPAIDKAIELGIADSTCLGLMGQSYGGYATYGLVTQTNRFKAAVALAGASDLISLYGQFDPRTRYDSDPHERMFMPAMSENGQYRMGVPPWKDPQRFIRNSPLFFVDRVETPVMIIQGDMDYVPFQQGEEFFMGLYRTNKRGAFVRYLGEDHLLQSPANARDMWRRVFAWFDEFFGGRKDDK